MSCFLRRTKHYSLFIGATQPVEIGSLEMILGLLIKFKNSRSESQQPVKLIIDVNKFVLLRLTVIMLHWLSVGKLTADLCIDYAGFVERG